MNNSSLITMHDSGQVPEVVPAPIRSAVPMPIYSAEYSVSTPSPAQPQPGSLLDYCDLIWGHKIVFAGCALAGVAIALAILLPQTPLYRARTTLEVQDINRDFVNVKLSSPVFESSPVDALTDIQTQIKILQSDTLIQRALDRSGISSPADLNPHHRETPHWAGFLNADPPSGGHETLVEIAGKRLKVGVTGQTRIVEVSFDATDPALAAKFANALTSEFIQQNVETRWHMNKETAAWLAGQLDELRRKLGNSETAVEEYARRQGLIYTADKQTVSEEKLRQVQEELSKATADRVEKQSRFEIARTASPETLPDVLNDNNLRALETNLTDLRRQKAELEVNFTGDYGKTKKLTAEIATLEEAVNRKRTEIVSRISNDLTQAQRREQLLLSAYNDQTARVTSDSQKSIQYDVLKREVDTNRQIYEAMLERVKESTIASAIKASNVRIVDPALPPLRPYKPNLPLGSAVGLLGGAMFGLVAIVFRARTDLSVQEPGEAGVVLGIPELGVIPRARLADRSVPVMIPSAQEKLLEAPENGSLSSSNHLEVADSFRAVLASILFGGAKEQQRVLVITSAGSGEGKTTTAANLATTLANMGRKVLLIDGDIRNPRIHKMFGLDNSTGVTNLLQQPVPGEVASDPSIRATSSPNLFVLTAGPAVPAGADLLFSTSIATLIGRYRELFDMVIIDTPPMLSMPDARLLGRIADGVVLVARAGKTSRAAVQAAFRRLVDDQSKVLGVVLNDWKVKSSPYSYGSAYKYYSNYAEARLSTNKKPADEHTS